MVKRKIVAYTDPITGIISLMPWLENMSQRLLPGDFAHLKKACELIEHLATEKTTSIGLTLLQQGLGVCDTVIELSNDVNTLISTLLYYFVTYGELHLQDINEAYSPEIGKIIAGLQKMELISANHKALSSELKLDNLRKMLLAMVDDIRIVFIKLAEQTFMMRMAYKLNAAEQAIYARLTFDIYAPLANRLGIGHLKWELEDLAFRYLYPDDYKRIAKHLDSTRLEREAYVEKVKHLLYEKLHAANLQHFEISGRVKHIYSIYKKMQKKAVDYHKIYDVTAVRILTEKTSDCYAALSCVHELWQHVPEEFDDYIARPKPNGYRSIHTAVKGPENKSVEVQIRTYDIHKEAELGIAAHWKYKESHSPEAKFEEKINWLRQLLAWQNDLPVKDAMSADIKHLFSDRVYVFTPGGDIIDLPKGATPLDFAYHIHTQVGHRCKGAKINGHIIPLTHTLTTGDKVEILTSKNSQPSRDWLNIHSGYLATAKARAKVFHFFKHLEQGNYLLEGKHQLEKELKHLHIQAVDLTKVAKHLGYRSNEDMLIAIGSDELKLSHVIHVVKNQYPHSVEEEKKHLPSLPNAPIHQQHVSNAVSVGDVSNLLSLPAKCCKPIPGDKIIGFITRGRGITIHRKDCPNIKHTPHPERLTEINWSTNPSATGYPVDIIIQAKDREGLLRDITTLFANEKIKVLSLQSNSVSADDKATIVLTIEIKAHEILQHILEKIMHVPSVNLAQRSH